jgi:hypothetical protein
MKDLLNTFLDHKTHRKTPHFSVKLKYVIIPLTQIKQVLNQLDLVLQKIDKRDSDNIFFYNQNIYNQ